MVFILQEGSTNTDSRTTPDIRIFLDEFKHTRAEIIAEVEAKSWIAAREIVADKYFL